MSTQGEFKEPRRHYPPYMKPPYSALDIRLAETMGRIADRCEDSERERREMRQALNWCRANGNPHLENPQ